MTYAQAMRWRNTGASNAYQRSVADLRFYALAQCEVTPGMSNREVVRLAAELFAQACGEAAFTVERQRA